MEPGETTPSNETAEACALCQKPIVDGQHDCAARAAPAGGNGANDRDDLKVGDIIASNWKVLSVLGEGGMGVVVKAQDLTLGRIVAVKVVHSRLLSDKGAIARFRQEAQASGGLDHPSIIRIHHFGVDEKQRPFLVMDMLEGTSLDAVLEQRGGLPFAEAIPILSQTCQALGHAHEHGVIHRDLKPSNVMLLRSAGDGGAPVVKLVDFGIAKVLPKPGVDGMKLTTTGEVLGSPLYMSPEQCLAMELDARSDIYSIGCLIYATLTGKPPFLNPNVYETYYQHINDLPESVGKHVPALKNAAEIDAVVLKCMAKDPADRYQSMAELKVALDELAAPNSRGRAGMKLLAPFQLMLLKAKAGKLRIPAWVHVIVAIVLLATAGGTAWYMGVFKAPMEQRWNDLYVKGQNEMNVGNYDAAGKDLDEALSLAHSSIAMKKYVAPALLQICDLKALVNDIPGHDRALKEYHAALADDVSATKRLIANLDRAIAEAKSDSSKSDRENYAQLCQDACDMAEVCIPQNRVDEAGALSKKAAALAEKVLNSPSYKALPLSLYSLGAVDHRKRDFAGAERAYQQAIDFLKKNSSASDPLVSNDLIGLGLVYTNLRQFDKALDALSQAQQIRVLAFTSQSEQVAWVKTCRGECYLTIADKASRERGIEELKQAKAIYDVVPNPIKHQRARCFAILAWAEGKKEEMENALALQQELLVQGKDYLVFLLDGLGDKVMENRAVSAIVDQTAYYKRALVVALRGGDRVNINREIGKIDNYYMAKNDLGKLKPLYLYILHVDSSEFGDRSAQVGADYLALCNLSRRLSNLKEAQQYCDKALETMKEQKEEGVALQVCSIYAAMIDLALDAKEPAKAREAFENLRSERGKLGSPPLPRSVEDSAARFLGFLKQSHSPDSDRFASAWH